MSLIPLWCQEIPYWKVWHYNVRGVFSVQRRTNTLKTLPPHSSQLVNYLKLTKMTRHSINSFCTHSLVNEAYTKSTLFMAVGVTHTDLESTANNLHDIRRSITKVRIMTGLYMLQFTRDRFNQYSVEVFLQLEALSRKQCFRLHTKRLQLQRKLSRNFLTFKYGRHQTSN